MLPAENDYVCSSDLWTFGDLVDDLDSMRLSRNLLHDFAETGIEISGVEIVRHDVVAVLVGEALGIRLARCELEPTRSKTGLRYCVVPLYVEGFNYVAFALVDMEGHTNISAGSIDLRSDFHTAISVRLVNI